MHSTSALASVVFKGGPCEVCCSNPRYDWSPNPVKHWHVRWICAKTFQSTSVNCSLSKSQKSIVGLPHFLDFFLSSLQLDLSQFQTLSFPGFSPYFPHPKNNLDLSVLFLKCFYTEMVKLDRILINFFPTFLCAATTTSQFFLWK